LLEALEKKRETSQIPRLCYRLHGELSAIPQGLS